MKTYLHKLLAITAVVLALAIPAQASQLWFFAQQGTGTQYPQTTGSVSIDNPTWASNLSSPAAPAIDVSMPFVDPFGGALFQAIVNTNVPTGSYYVGSFPSGSDCWIWIY